jgi:rubredoxin
MTSAMETTTEYQQWVCQVCSWVYDEAAGAPEHGLAPGTRFADISEDWYCPECGVTKADFTLLDF